MIFQRIIDPALRKAAARAKPQTPAQNDQLSFIQSLALPDGKPYSFAQHEDLIEIARDNAQVVVIRKAAQKGATELMLRLQLYLASQGYHSAYYLRSRHYMRIQVQRRVEPLIAANKILQKALVREESENDDPDAHTPRKYRLTDNMSIKRLWSGYCIYLGLQSEADVRSFPLDAIFVDEVETLKSELTDALQERLYHSTLKWQRWFSQPTAIGFGIDEKYQLTDQRHQLFKCARCSNEIILEESFPRCVMVDAESRRILLSELHGSLATSTLQPDSGQRFSAHYCCPRCHAPINPVAANWRWVAKYPSRSAQAHGYHLTQLYSATLTPTDVALMYLRAQSPRALERFYNSVLGLPYLGGDRQPIHPDKLTYTDHPVARNDESACYLGVDVGDALHMVALQPPYIVAVEQFKGSHKWRDLYNRILALKPRAAAINAMPYKDSAKDLIKQLKTQRIDGVLIYDTSDNAKPTVGYEDEEFGEPVRRITYPRADLMDGTVNALLRGEIILPPRNSQQTQLLLKHLLNYIVELDEQGNRHYAKGREDHLGRALDYARLIAQSAAPLRLAPPNYGSPQNWLVPESSYKPARL